MKPKVTILGAGCSRAYGYPLASEMREHLRAFGTQIQSTAPKLHRVVLDTLELFKELERRGCRAETIDDAAWLIHQGKMQSKPGTFQDEHNDRLVENAKVAVSAMFLAKEDNPEAKALTAYRNLLRRLFPNETNCERALSESSWRILTFNYDRLFELAFRQHFAVDTSQTFYGPKRLNSGLFLVDSAAVKVDTNRFSLLKLHGSVGFSGVEEYGECHHYQMIPDPTQPVPITDETFFLGDGYGIYSNRPKPSLIVFPHEKDYLKEYPDNRFPFRAYIPEIWRAAAEFMTAAEEVWIVGYSMPESDWQPMDSLLKRAPQSCRIIVHNPQAETIVAKVRARVPSLAGRIEAYVAPFGG